MINNEFINTYTFYFYITFVKKNFLELLYRILNIRIDYQLF